MKCHRCFLIPAVLVLSACSVPKERFDCPPGKGVGCRSMSEVHEMLNQGKLEGIKGASHKPGFHQNLAASPHLIPDNFQSDSMVLERIKEEHLRVWIAPFQDAQGDFHEGSVLHTVLKPGRWKAIEKGA